MLTAARRTALRERRQHIAAAVEAGEPVPDIIARLGVSIALVRAACDEHGVELPRRNIAGRPLRVIADLLHHPELRQAEVARRHGINDRRVSALAKAAREAGILPPLAAADAPQEKP